MFDTINGVPAHPLVVHAVVVLVPLAALVTLAAASSGRFRRWSGLLTPLLATAALVSVPLATSTGEELEDRVTETALTERHTDMGEGLLPWVVGLAVVAWGLWWLGRRARRERTVPRALVVVGLLLAMTTVVGSGVQVYRIGHSGAEAVWSDVGTKPGGEDD